MNFVTVDQVNAQGLSRLLGQTYGPDWTAEDGAVALRHQLAAPLLPDLAITKAVDSKELEAYLHAYDGPAQFGMQLTSGAPSLFLLKAIKHFAKQVSADSANPLCRDTALVLYFASIAAAFTGCGKSISSTSEPELREQFRWAAQQPGAETLRGLFESAIRALSEGTAR